MCLSFVIGSSGNNIWHSYVAGGDNPRIGTIPVGVFGVRDVYTLMGTFWGEHELTTHAAIEFYGSAGAFFHFDLDGNAQIRDYNYNPNYTTALDPNYAIQVWDNGSGQHLDMQHFVLPTAFQSQTLASIVVVDFGGDGFQRLFISGATVNTAPVPAPATLLLLGPGLAGLAALKRKFKK